jgi:two-component system, OmpR family, phosphate regulon sensor histidine kinase PhoR
VGPRSRALVAGVTAMLEKINSGGTGLAAIGQLLDDVQAVLGAVGVAASEYVESDGRVIATTGLLAPFVGMRFDGLTDQARKVKQGPGVHEYEVSDAQPMIAQHLVAFGIDRLLVAGAEADGEVVCTVTAVYGKSADADQIGILSRDNAMAIMRMTAAIVGHLYTDGVGLPVLGGGADAADRGPGRRDISERSLFVAMASHELRTPVTVIKGYADTLSDHWDALDTSSKLDAVRILSQRAGELARLVDRLLTSAVGAEADHAPAPFDLVASLRTASSDLPANLRRRVVVALPPELPMASGNRADMQTVLTELVINADKYSASAEPITLTGGSDSRTVFFRVSDRGIGVRPDEVELAFARYWQGDDLGATRRPGVGLGLYLVRKTIERQNGWVSLRPRDGGGTVAEVRLPRGDLNRSGEA